MPQDLSASALPYYIAGANAGWGNNSSTNNERTMLPVTASAVLENMVTRISPAAGEALENCQTVRFHWLQPETKTGPGWQSAIQDEDCVIPAGSTISSEVQDMVPNFSWKSNFSIDANTCGNHIQVAALIRQQMDNELGMCSRDLNLDFLTRLETNKAIVPGTVTTEIPDVTIIGGNYVVSDSSYWGASPEASKIMGVAEGIARENGFGDYYIVAGGSLFAATFNAMYDAANDNQRSHVLRFGHMPLYLDIMNYRDIAGTKSFFIVEKSVMAAYFRNEYGTKAVTRPLNDTTTTMFSVPLHFYNNAANDGGAGTSELRYRINGMMEQIRVDVRVQTNCGGTTAWGVRQDIMNFELRATGIIQDRPQLTTAHTGIIKVSDQ